MWSSWACVIRKPRTRSFRVRRYPMSGMTRSMPSICSSGNIRPASMTRTSSPISIASMFLPISPTPPRGMIRSGPSALAKERDLLRGFCFRLRFGRRGGREVRGERAEVADEGVPQGRLMEGGGRVVDGEDHEAVGGAARLPMDARDRLAGKELPHRVPPERDDGAGSQHFEVAPQPDVASGDLVADQPQLRRRSVLHRADYETAEIFIGALRAR